MHRLVVIGDDRHRLHEEIVRAGGVIRQGRFARLNVGEIEAALGRVHDQLPSRTILSELTKLWPRIDPGVVQSLDARRDERMQYVSNALDRRRDKEVADISGILEELRRSVQAELRNYSGRNSLKSGPTRSASSSGATSTASGHGSRQSLRRSSGKLKPSGGGTPTRSRDCFQSP